MDPAQTLLELLEAYDRVRLDPCDDDARREVDDRLEALTEWASKGGAPPDSLSVISLYLNRANKPE